MKFSSIITFGAAALVCTGSTLAQAKKKPLLAAMIVNSEGKRLTNRPVIVESILKNKLLYRKDLDEPQAKSVVVNTQKAIYLARPADFVAAVELYEKRQYELALTAFKEIKKKYKNFSDIKNSFVAQAEFYELGCYRKLGQFETFVAAKKAASQEKWLTKESQKQQLKIDTQWVQLQDKANHSGLITEYEKNWREEKLPNALRAQVEFIYAKALESEGRTGEALIAYNKAMVADFSGADVLTQAIVSALTLLENDPEVKEVRELWDNRERAQMKAKLNSSAYTRLLEMSAMIRVHDRLGLSGYKEDGSIINLPERFGAYGKYTKEAAEKFSRN